MNKFIEFLELLHKPEGYVEKKSETFDLSESLSFGNEEK